MKPAVRQPKTRNANCAPLPKRSSPAQHAHCPVENRLDTTPRTSGRFGLGNPDGFENLWVERGVDPQPPRPNYTWGSRDPTEVSPQCRVWNIKACRAYPGADNDDLYCDLHTTRAIARRSTVCGWDWKRKPSRRGQAG